MEGITSCCVVVSSSSPDCSESQYGSHDQGDYCQDIAGSNYEWTISNFFLWRIWWYRHEKPYPLLLSYPGLWVAWAAWVGNERKSTQEVLLGPALSMYEFIMLDTPLGELREATQRPHLRQPKAPKSATAHKRLSYGEGSEHCSGVASLDGANIVRWLCRFLTIASLERVYISLRPSLRIQKGFALVHSSHHPFISFYFLRNQS